ncbi:MAG: BlaI/MecI/CopY family transcriptional regulator [Duncaniella sp.]|nr:BlaI/MecI/CopY family transcriptional regulator [Duncaniella sp.]MDE5751693.1 BlaI/MecI/CopY family transcriptional regulator [Duncaniella sp.]MDE6170816.1 BlaI/MecI/CopY family transcriptional regulator [Duncaniella sp.]MDE6328891.1 BlaI/MecI/CopY family transcriptional regulator [Duncaniella sp.]MDE6765265.1 BlaI/MecI/CopY family transcriptional regulator [Duncaniella sp.]
MKAGRKRQVLTEKESVIMNMLWSRGPLFVREMLEAYPEPRPHFNTVATTVRILEEKGYVAHEVLGGSHRFYAVADKNDFRDRSLAEVIRNYFDNSYKSAVSALAEEEKISVDELREIIEIIENRNRKS